jgi:type II secretory pathway component GspD/PulD (secretin)
MPIFAHAQRLPSELQVSQIESAQIGSQRVVVAVAPQAPQATGLPQIPAVQLEERPLTGAGVLSQMTVREAELRAFLSTLAQAGGLTLSMAPDITGTVDADFMNVTLNEALDAVLTPLGLEFQIVGKILRVTREQLQRRQFTFDYLTTPRGLDLLTDVEADLSALVSPSGKIVFNRMAGVVLVSDFPRNLEAIEIFLETVQNAVNRQVVIEAKIVEVRLNENFQAGVDLRAALGNAAAGIDPAPIAVTRVAGDLILSALALQGTVDVRSSPEFATLNNQTAVIRSEGVDLDVTAQISDDGIIMMNIHPTVTNVADSRETDTVVRVAEGETVVIAGLFSDRALERTSKVPVLGDIPVMGGLFRKTGVENQKTDLVILLTPRILTLRAASEIPGR